MEMELLAPAGSFEAFKAAVENGADAVYLGGQSFNARANAANFSIDELRKVVQYAHEREAMVYVTVNILIADREFPELYDYLYDLYDIGVDALILQDIGVAELIQSVLPEMERHASTQMTINTTWGVRHAEKLGFQRVVFAREVTAEEMKKISATTPLDIEVFVHGALCICYSGQCLMSSYIGGRSGNRGRCAQPCRLTYQLMNEDKTDLLAEANLGNHLLSPRDLNFVEEIRNLQECGVYSLKVEGRMKRPEYVATVIRVYRRALDQVLSEEDNKSVGSGVTEEEKTELLQIFNRDFSQGYFHGHPGAELMSYARPNNRGIRLGRITKNTGNQLEIKLEAFLRAGDGIEIWTSRGREGITVGKVWQGKNEIEVGNPGEIVQIDFVGKSHPGDRVFKTHDELLMDKARQSFQEGKEQRKRPLKMRLAGTIGEVLTLEVEDRHKRIKVNSSIPAQQAMKRPLTQEYAFQQLGRLGTTPFWLEELEFEVEDGVMLPVSELNEMRRLAVEGLLQSAHTHERVTRGVYRQRLKDWKDRLQSEHEMLQAEQGRSNKQQRISQHKEYAYRDLGLAAAKNLTVAVSDLEGVKAALIAGARRIAMGGERWRSRKGMSLEDLRTSVRLCREQGADCLLRLPRILNEEQSTWWQDNLKKIKEWKDRPSIMVSNLGELEMLKSLDSDWPFEVDYTVNLFNEAAIAHFLRLGAQGVTLSTELEHSQIERLARWPNTELFVFGDLEMMVSEYCPVGATLGGKKGSKCSVPCVKEPHCLRDRLKYDFPIETDLDCRMHLYNVKRLNLYKELGAIAKMGVQRIRLQLDRATPVQIRDTIRVFLEGWERALDGERISEEQAEKVSAYLEDRFPEGFTKGHYFRGVL
ncbi:U32 family peptidase [Desulfitobacterium dichloroeliminans]